jgi:hypothetical protein
MSHFSKCALKIKNLVALKQALDDLGLTYTTSNAEVSAFVRGWKGAKVEAELSINMGKYDIGVVKNEDGTYDLTADWWGVETTQGISEQEFTEQLNQKYAYQCVMIACEEQGYATEDVKTEEDGTIKLMASKWE